MTQTPAPSEEETEIFDAAGHRKALFSQLAHVLVVSREKFDCEKAANDSRQKWARIIVSAVEAYGRILQTVALEELEQRVLKLEKSGSEHSEQKS
jgi:BMFP domain-containing protein YqiC